MNDSGGGGRKTAFCSLLWYSQWPSAVDILASCYFSTEGVHAGVRACVCVLGRRDTSAEIISSFCQKAKRWIGYLRKGISPQCKLWIKQQNMLGCHTLVPLTFLYLTVTKKKKNPFFPFILSPCLCNYHVPILPCPHSHPQYPEGLAVFLLVQQLPPLSLWNKKFGVGY